MVANFTFIYIYIYCQLGQTSSLTDSVPSLNLLCHSKIDARFMQDAPKAVWSIPYISLAFLSKFKTEFYLNACTKKGLENYWRHHVILPFLLFNPSWCKTVRSIVLPKELARNEMQTTWPMIRTWFDDNCDVTRLWQNHRMGLSNPTAWKQDMTQGECSSAVKLVLIQSFLSPWLVA